MSNGPTCDLSKPWDEAAPRKFVTAFEVLPFKAGTVTGRAYCGTYAAGAFPPAGEFCVITPDLGALQIVWEALMVIPLETSKTQPVVVVDAEQFKALLAMAIESSSAGHSE